jgi:hypothetical protein
MIVNFDNCAVGAVDSSTGKQLNQNHQITEDGSNYVDDLQPI